MLVTANVYIYIIILIYNYIYTDTLFCSKIMMMICNLI